MVCELIFSIENLTSPPTPPHPPAAPSNYVNVSTSCINCYGGKLSIFKFPSLDYWQASYQLAEQHFAIL